MTKPQLWVVAGPNGAGKTTLVTQRLASRPLAEQFEVVNPDVIAQSLPRIHGRLDERGAGEAAVLRRNLLLANGTSLAIETTLSGQSTLRFMRRARSAGYRITLVFVGIDVIGGHWLTEINVTSPTGIVAIDAFNGTDSPALIWDAIERRQAERVR